jgi:hypothetical protein
VPPHEGCRLPSRIGAPPVASWLAPNVGDLPPSLHEHYTRFVTTTGQSAPLRRIGTFAQELPSRRPEAQARNDSPAPDRRYRQPSLVYDSLRRNMVPRQPSHAWMFSIFRSARARSASAAAARIDGPIWAQWDPKSKGYRAPSPVIFLPKDRQRTRHRRAPDIAVARRRGD